MSNLFHAYSVQGANIPTYFIESTAPNNVDDSPAPASAPSGLTSIDPDKAVEDIATHLSRQHEAHEPECIPDVR